MALFATAESINARSEKLFDEFVEYWEHVRASDLEVTDRDTLGAFVVWQNNKIAGLQEICLEMSRRIACLSELVVGNGGQVFEDLIEEAVSEQIGRTAPDFFDSLTTATE